VLVVLLNITLNPGVVLICNSSIRDVFGGRTAMLDIIESKATTF
jgi:hypothetical protein